MPTTRSTPRRARRTGREQLIHGFPPYEPAADEPYMSPAQLEHFRMILLAWKRELLEGFECFGGTLPDDTNGLPDHGDQATHEVDAGSALRTREREHRLLEKIEAALERIENGTYGYCAETGQEIGLRRLEAHPLETLCQEARDRQESARRQLYEST